MLQLVGIVAETPRACCRETQKEKERELEHSLFWHDQTGLDLAAVPQPVTAHSRVLTFGAYYKQHSIFTVGGEVRLGGEVAQW